MRKNKEMEDGKDGTLFNSILRAEARRRGGALKRGGGSVLEGAAARWPPTRASTGVAAVGPSD